MGHISIYCDSCGSRWDVYGRDDLKNKRSRTCPICRKAIDQGVWDRQIVKAFEEMESATRDLVTNHLRNRNALFTVSYIPDVIYPNRRADDQGDLREEISEMNQKIENLQDRIDKIYK